MEEEKYSNWTEGYVRGGMLMYGGMASLEEEEKLKKKSDKRGEIKNIVHYH